MKTRKLIIVFIMSFIIMNAAKADLLPEMYKLNINNYYYPAVTPYLSYTNTYTSIKLNSPGNWKLCYEADDIFIYERWIKQTKGDSIRERKGMMMAVCDISKAVKLITSYADQKYWMKNIKENKLIKRKSDSSWITHTVFSLPWPLDNRDVVSEYHVQNIDPSSYILIKINSVSGLVRETHGITRINSYNATWAIKKVNNGCIAISFCASTEPQHSIPAVILDPLMRRTFQKNLYNLRKMLA